MNTIYNFEGNCFDQFTALEELNLNHLNAQGNITAEFVKNLKNLRSLNLAYNNLQGPLPDIDQWKDIKHLRFLELNNNNFTGVLPSIWPDSFPHLEFLNI